MRLIVTSLILFGLAACAPPAVEARDPAPISTDRDTTEAPEALAVLSWGDLLSEPKPVANETVVLGDASWQVVDVWLPEVPGPHPVVVMVHGGCWQKAIADRTLMNYAAEDLRQRGFAVWNIEYRGVDEAGGGYPGTYLDVAAASDALRLHAVRFDLDLTRVAGIGHSAGGHLVTWLAARPRLAETSPLHSEDPLALVGVVNSGGLADLALSRRVTQADCLADIAETLTGPPSEARPDVYSDTSPAALLPIGPRLVSVSGDLDRISPPGLARALAELDRAVGGRAEALIIDGNNHVDLIAPGTASWEAQATLLEDMLAPR